MSYATVYLKLYDEKHATYLVSFIRYTYIKVKNNISENTPLQRIAKNRSLISFIIKSACSYADEEK